MIKKILSILSMGVDTQEKFNVTNCNIGKNVIIGNNCEIVNSELRGNSKVGRDSYLYNVNYGEYSYNSIRVTLINCTIGKFCSIAQGVSVGLGMHPINKFVSTHPAFYSIHKQCGISFTQKQKFEETGYVEIGHDVWIGVNSVISDNVRIGNGAVIAANSFVNSNIPDYAIAGGNPAKVIKFRFNEEQIDFLNKLKWWDKDSTWLEDNQELMLDINSLIEKHS